MDGVTEQGSWIAAPLPVGETKRLEALNSYNILDTDDEQSYDDLTHLACILCATPISTITLVDRDRQWFKSMVGVENREDPRAVSFCAHAILEPGSLLHVEDASMDARFAKNPLVVGGPQIRFYAGVPLVTKEGAALGTICVIDREPRRLNPAQQEALHCLARRAVAQIEMRGALAELQQQSLTDGLTGAWNRRAFDMLLQKEWARQSRLAQPLSLLMIDIDHFKRVNDSLGHMEGDLVLKRVTQLLTASLRPSDYLIRYGGEEFLVLLSGFAADAARIVGERLRMEIDGAEWPKGGPVTVSVGVSACTPTKDGEPNLLIAQADHALYAAKNTGRNRVEVFQAWM